ncbi:4-hydroxy-tetrahydrodipicolinate synthase [Tuwongella immobilis]|uniref:4-hydroxy-tetrahydrodipicolinate synthase n=1 Tax=Tuwongella immobilis TaxID=692036 RepID=A0A6C2YPS2_9BACT|nr:4-hydroxy-tetrahydrodipicolinate synthase [Tuwongella immobilis]VIP03311.1 dihydrodipicolinate synthase : 4-hydroxy-tetrahydrodipicolinate synthase OS=Pirellula staleyi (strain ATCC 27377 / DSM 6068 / ICPB 4128) GN=dapA PE=3 SV=1: DHDPS [Tuwongella immobilis]VTS03993.1 dihydrodipicolinate synthase : 4-hydroxy-tetrahydrodipicolinate synthase OS=Pirellula staleyi (strain ATCC 27377 / DSM 6068 / ICPB 4128) GN=dapA PE=3 SV=1: DHDPS [Tuwongella immobilis]
MSRGAQFAGVTVALVTPFRNGEIDFAALKRLVDWHVEQGTDCLAPVGTTGESPTLDHDEHEKVIATVVEHARGRIKIMPGTGSNNTREAVRLTKFAKSVGANGSLMVGPYYNKPTQEGYFRHFAAVADAVDLPIVLYNIPGRTGSNINPETIIRIAEAIPTVVAVKEATGSLDQASQIAVGSDLTILSGDDSLTLPLMSIGGEGIISVVGNIIPKDMLALVKAFKDGQIAEATRLHQKLFPLCRDMLSVATNPIPVKAAMKLLGMDSGELRLPMVALDAAGEARVRQTLVNYGLLPA